jgi:hypothetical protein
MTDTSPPPDPNATTPPAPPVDSKPARRQRSDAGKLHEPMTEERKQRYIEGLRQSASHRFAAQYATGAGNTTADPRWIGFAYQSFLKLRRADPIFATACDEAMQEALGALEADLFTRTKKPDWRRQYDPKTGNLIGESESWEPANRLGRAILARHDSDWIDAQKKQIEVKYTGGSAGLAFSITPELTALLDDEEKLQLSTLMRAMMERKEQQQVEQQSQKKIEDMR